MTAAILSPRADGEAEAAASWIKQENPATADEFLDAVTAAAERIGEHPNIGISRPDLAPAPFRILFLTGFSYVLVYDAERRPPLIARIVHAARDLPELLQDL